MKKTNNNEDNLILGGSKDGETPYLRSKGGVLEAGTLRVVEEGVPIQKGEELALLTPQEDGSWDVESLYGREGNGPAMVSTPAYKTGWDRIFGGSKKAQELN